MSQMDPWYGVSVRRITDDDPEALREQVRAGDTDRAPDWDFDPDAHDPEKRYGGIYHKARKEYLGVESWTDYLNSRAPAGASGANIDEAALADAVAERVDVDGGEVVVESDALEDALASLTDDVKQASYQGAKEAVSELQR